MSSTKKQKPSSSHVSASAGSSGAAPHDAKLRDMLKELHTLVMKVQEERSRSEHNLSTIGKMHEKIQSEQKSGKSISSYCKGKLKTLYGGAISDAENEAAMIQRALTKISEIKEFKNEKLLAASTDGDRPKQLMRRGVLMQVLQHYATSLALWVGRPREDPPPLCGAVPPDATYIAERGDKVAARVKGQDGDENWILAECVSFDRNNNKYEIDDIDADEDQERRHVLSRRRVVPLPKWRANPETHPEALYPKGTLVLALYPQTTCFYRGVIDEPPETYSEDYSVLFEDTTYPGGYSPPLAVAQRYVVICKDTKKK